MQFDEWALLALSCFIGASSPGPSIALMMRAVLRDGRIAGLIFAFSHGFGIMLYAGLVATGIFAVLVVMPSMMLILQILGLGFLIYVSQGMIRGGLKNNQVFADDAAPSGQDQHDTPVQPDLLTHGRDGFLIVFLNPKVAAFFLAIFSQFLNTDQDMITRIGMTMLAWAIDTGWYILMAFFLTMPVILKRLRQHHGMIEVFMGALLAAAAVIMAMRMVISL